MSATRTLSSSTAPGAPPARSGPALAAAGVTAASWASAFVVIRSVGVELSPGPLALARLAVAAAVLTPIVALRRGGRPLLPRGRTAWQVTVYGLLWFAGYNVVLNAAERSVDAGTAALLVNVAPLLIAVGSGALLGEGFPRPVLVGCAVGLAGVGVMALGAGARPGGTPVGLALALLAAVLYAASVLVQKVALREVDGLRATWLGCVVGTVALLPFAPQLAGELPSASRGAVLGAVYLGAVPTALAFTTWAYALSRMPAGRLSPVGYVATVLAMVMSWAFLGEAPTGLVVLGGVLSLAGVAISRRR